MASKSVSILFLFFQCLFLQNVLSFTSSPFVNTHTLHTASATATANPSFLFTPQPAKTSSQTTPTTLYGKKAARAQGNDRKNKTERVRKQKDDVIEVEAVVIESLPNAMFRCGIEGAPESQPPILATISGKIRKNYVKILVGDKVTIELSPYDLTRGRITFRKR